MDCDGYYPVPDDHSLRLRLMLDTHNGTATLIRLADGQVRVEQADLHITIHNDLLERSDVASLVIDGDLVSFGDINRVTYRIVWRGEDYVQADRVD